MNKTQAKALFLRIVEEDIGKDAVLFPLQGKQYGVRATMPSGNRVAFFSEAVYESLVNREAGLIR